MVFPAKYSSLNAMEITDSARKTLVRVLRVAFPHNQFPDGPYERTADTILHEAENETWFRVALVQGLMALDQQSEESFVDLDDETAIKVLRRIECTEFFGFVRRTAVLNLYDDDEVWMSLGYEGASFDQGGYINRGFNDLSWLPDPRIYYPDEPIPEVGESAHASYQKVFDDADPNPGAEHSLAAEGKATR